MSPQDICHFAYTRAELTPQKKRPYGIGGGTTGAQGARAPLKFQDSTVLIYVAFAHL